MKYDMCGGANVIGALIAIAKLKLKINAFAVVPATENLVNGKATKPGDVHRARNGKTFEVNNTDAEGRLTLADGLIYAAHQKPDCMIDLATLTGACVSALGEEIAGLFTDDELLAERLLRLSRETGDVLWRLPLYSPYADLIHSKIADLKNIAGKSGGGAITAALFLKHFVGKIPWAHLDIAGPSYTERETRPDQPYGASGHGVRLLLRLLEELEEKV
jgi:leucyl aminopeptidase